MHVGSIPIHSTTIYYSTGDVRDSQSVKIVDLVGFIARNKIFSLYVSSISCFSSEQLMRKVVCQNKHFFHTKDYQKTVDFFPAAAADVFLSGEFLLFIQTPSHPNFLYQKTNPLQSEKQGDQSRRIFNYWATILGSFFKL
jgi:hypothetical protein